MFLIDPSALAARFWWPCLALLSRSSARSAAALEHGLEGGVGEPRNHALAGNILNACWGGSTVRLVPEPEKIVAVALLTESNLRTIGKNLERVYPVEELDGFEDLLTALARADASRPWTMLR
jgi:hypothetical protein